MSAMFSVKVPDWQTLSAGQWPVKALALGCCLLVVIALGYVGHLRGVLATFDKVMEQRTHLHAEREEKRTQAGLVVVRERELEAMQASLRYSSEALIDEEGLPGLLQDISHAGQGLLFEQLTVLQGRSQAFPVEVPLRVQALGSYGALSNFVAAMSDMSTLMTLHELELLAADDVRPGQLRMSLLAKAYRSSVPRPVANPAVPAPQSLRDPFVLPMEAAAGPLLQRYPLDQLTWVGSLADQRGHVALLNVAGHVHPARVGDVLGKENARVVRIAEQQVELLEPLSLQDAGEWERARFIRGPQARP